MGTLQMTSPQPTNCDKVSPVYFSAYMKAVKSRVAKLEKKAVEKSSNVLFQLICTL